MSFLTELKDEQLEERGLYVVCTCRDDDSSPELESLLHDTTIKRITLSRLSHSSVGEMVSGMLALSGPPTDLTDLMFRESNGNPFFVAEYLRAAIEQGLLQRDLSAGWQIRGRGPSSGLSSSVPPPMSVRSLMTRRLDCLDARTLEIVRAASVLGREFDADLLLAASPDFDPSAIALLRQRAIIEEGEGGFLRFSHDRLRELAYAGIPRERRPDFHRRSAIALEARHGQADTLNAHLPALAHHWSMAGERDRAALAHVRAGDRARDVYANREAVAHYDAAIAEMELISSIESGARAEWEMRHRQVQESRADLLTLIGRHDEARQALDSALANIEPKERVWRARLLWKRARTLETEHRHAEALAIYDAAEAALGPEPEGDSNAEWWSQWTQLQVERVWVHYWLADVMSMKARVERVRPHIEHHASSAQRARFFQALTHSNLRSECYAVSAETVELARDSVAAAELQEKDVASHAYARFLLGFALLFYGDLADAGRELTRALGDSQRTGDLALQARVLTYLTLHYRLCGEVARTAELAAKSLKVAEEIGMDDYAGAALANLGWVAWREARHDVAQQTTASALVRWRRLAPKYDYPFQWLAQLHALEATLTGATESDPVLLAAELLKPLQHRLPEAIHEALREAWLAGAQSPELAKEHLRRALAAARTLKYI